MNSIFYVLLPDGHPAKGGTTPIAMRGMKKNKLEGIPLQSYLTWHAFFSALALMISLLFLSI